MVQTKKVQTSKSEITVIGGGPVGLTQTLMLAQNNFQITCIDRNNADPNTYKKSDGRTTAISYGSHKLLKSLGVWKSLEPYACPIKSVDILDGNSPILMNFAKDEIDDGAEAFGWVIENYLFLKILYEAINKHENVTHLTKIAVKNYDFIDGEILISLSNNHTIQTSLVIGADGRQSFTREWMAVGTRQWDYNQCAIVSIVTHEKPHQNIAVEHFKHEGPFAILPMLDTKSGEHRSSIVWTQERSKQVENISDDAYLMALNTLFPNTYGRITSSGKKFTYPLNFNHAYDYISPNMVLIGDAAHGIHPIAGQGLNLGLRDVAALTQVLSDAKTRGEIIGDIEVLKKYQAIRRPDNIAMAATTDFLNRVFSNNSTPTKLARTIGLKIMDRFKPAKRIFIKQAMGTSGHLPKIMSDK